MAPQLNESKAAEPPTVESSAVLGLLRGRLEEAHRLVDSVLATAIRCATALRSLTLTLTLTLTLAPTLQVLGLEPAF